MGILNEIEKHNGLLSVHLNVRSLWNKIDIIRNILSDQKVDIATFSETWLTSNIPDEFIDINGYNIVRNDRNWSDDPIRNVTKKGGGVCTYIKDGLNYKVNTIPELTISTKDIECHNFELILGNQKNVLIVNLYRPPQGDVDIFINLFDLALQNIDFVRKDIIILGDFNIDFLDKSNVNTKGVNRFVFEYGLTKLINNPTRYGVTKNSCIDQIITNSDHILHAGVSDVNISDHELIFFVKKKKKGIPTKTTFNGRSYRNYDTQNFIDFLDDQNWELFGHSEDPNTLWEIMLKNIKAAIDMLCPLKTFKIKKYKEPWITQELIELIKDKDILLKRAKRSNLPEDWVNARRHRNDCLSKIRRAKSEFITSELDNNKSDSKKFWNNIKTVLPINNKSNKKILLTNPDTNQDIHEADVAGYINDFFANIGPNLASDFNTPWSFDGVEVGNKLEDIVATREEVLKLCKDIDTNKSSCIDDISSRVLKDALIHLNDKFTQLINKSFHLGIVPDLWKCAKVSPLFKGGDRNFVTNFRPVSLLPLPSKIIEKIVHNRMTVFFDENDILDPNQGGFRKKHSTIDTIAHLTNDIFNGINSGKLTMSCFIDMAKAFDTVNHVILCKKICKLGLAGNILKWVKNYLCQRKQCTYANGTMSTYLNISCGVPQGSILGPLFFIVYVNDIKSSLKACKYLLYADDTVLYLTGNLEQSTIDLQTDLSNFKKWTDKNQLTMNVKKTKYVVFGLKSKTRKVGNHSMFINDHRLERVTSYKYLGLTLDMNLNYNKHLENCLKLISHKAFLLNKIRLYIDTNTAITIYKTMILPILEYGDVIYDGANQKLLNDLQTSQNRILRICLQRNYYTSTILLHRICNINKLKDRRVMHLNLYMFKQKGNVDIVNTRNVCTRAHDAVLYTTIKPNNEKFKRNIFYKGALSWNTLPVSDRNVDRYEVFKDIQKKKVLKILDIPQV